MTRGQRLSAALGVAGAILLVGRAVAVIYSNREWYVDIGAASVWNSRVVATAWIFGTATVVGVTFAWLNIAAVRRSVVALIVPKRLANVEFGEEVPSSRLQTVAAAVSLGIAVVSFAAVPSWTTVALWRSNIVFAETDPYFTLDLSHFVSWLPLEISMYQWSLALFAITAIIVVALYALTPSLNWDHTGLHVTPYVRRHMSVLGAMLLLFAAWGFRLDGFRELIEGSGVNGLLTRTDHVWLIPAYLALSLVSIGAAVVLLVAGWMGQITTALASISVVIAGAIGSQVVGPWLSARIAADPANAKSERPYRETRNGFDVRAFPNEPAPPSIRFIADSALLATAGEVTLRGTLPNVVYPNAAGDAVFRDTARVIRAPRLGNGLSRLMHAWAEQNPHLLSSSIKSNDAFVRIRDVRARVATLAPVFAVSGTVGAIPTSRGMLWIVDLYSASETYPLSAPRQLYKSRITYRHHIATAYVSGGTAATVIVPDSVLDPIARAWFARHPGRYIVRRVPAALIAPPATQPETPVPSSSQDKLFHQDVARIYDQMRNALDSGDLRAFGSAFDSLGQIIRGRH